MLRRLAFGLLSFGLAVGGVLAPAGALAATAKATPAPTPAPSVAPDAPLTLETSPLPITLIANPGTAVSTDLRVKQAGPETATLQVSLLKFTAFGDTGKPELLNQGPGDSYFDWVHFDKTVFSAPPNVWETVHMTIDLPKSAAFGYYYAVVFSRAGDAVKRVGDTNALAGATATLVLLDANNPNAKRTLQLVSFTSTHRLYEFLPASFNVQLANAGNVFGAPIGDVFITQGKKTLATIPFNGQAGNILPGSGRIFQVDWNDGFPIYQDVMVDGKVKLDKNSNEVKSLTWNWAHANKLRFGEYSAQLVALYDDGTNSVPIQATVSFWVIPWRFLLAFLVVIALVGLGVYALVRGTVRGVARQTRRADRRRP